MQNKADTLKEDRNHGNALFPLAAYMMECNPGEPVVNCHWHEEAEFLYIVEGSAQFQIGTTNLELNAGEAVYIHGGEIHAGYPLYDSGCKFFAIVLDMNMLHSGSHDLIESEYIVPLLEGRIKIPQHFKGSMDWEKRVLRCLNEIWSSINQKPNGFELSIKAQLFMILAEMAAGSHWTSNPQLSTSKMIKLDRLKTVLAYIESHYHEKITIEQLAKMSYMSEGHFCRFFKSLVRKTPISYINTYRLKRAMVLLSKGNQKLTDIAHEVGFDNISYFIKKFKKETNMTPSEYKQRYSDGD